MMVAGLQSLWAPGDRKDYPALVGGPKAYALRSMCCVPCTKEPPEGPHLRPLHGKEEAQRLYWLC